MYSLKLAHLIRERTGAEVYNFYIDMRTPGKGYEEFYDRLLDEGVHFVRGRVAEVTDWPVHPSEEGKLIIRAEDTLAGFVRRIPVDMVVLSVGLEPQSDARDVRRMFNISCSEEGWFLERHPKLAPVSTFTDGVFIAGACQGPKDIPDSVAQAGAAAAEAMALGRCQVCRAGALHGTRARRCLFGMQDLSDDLPLHRDLVYRGNQESPRERSAVQGLRHLRCHLSVGLHRAEPVRRSGDLRGS